MAGFKLFVFDREAHFIGPQESGCSTIGRSQKAVWILAHPTKTSSLRRSFVSAYKQIREDFKWFMISGRATASRKLQSGFGLALVIDGMQQIKREEEPRNNL